MFIHSHQYKLTFYKTSYKTFLRLFSKKSTNTQIIPHPIYNKKTSHKLVNKNDIDNSAENQNNNEDIFDISFIDLDKVTGIKNI